MLPWILCGILLLVVSVLVFKIVVLKKSMREISTEFEEHLFAETNTLIAISSRDRHAKELASRINTQLRLLRKQRRQYLSGDRELKETVTNISHDLRTPLTAICGYLELLEQEEKPREARRYVSIIKDRAQALKQLTEELFRYSVIMATESELMPETVVINDVLEESIADFYMALKERGIAPDIQVCEKKVIRYLDRAALSRVFSNLMNNAIKYSSGDLHISLTDAGEISFSNTAPELDEVQVGKLFDRFYTVEAARKSTGLGLAIARTLVEKMNGTISANYSHGKLHIHILFL